MGRQRSIKQIQLLVIHHSADNATSDQLIRERARRNEGYNLIIQDIGKPDDKQVKLVQDAPDTEISNGTYGANTESWNIVVPGNFENQKPTPDQIHGLVQALAIKAKAFGWRKRDISKITYHQYVGAYLNAPGWRYGTACPGRNLISRMSEIRQRVAAYLPE